MREWENPEVFAVNKRLPLANRLFFLDKESLYNYNFKSLNGEWDFRFFPDHRFAEQEFYQTDFSTCDWDQITVPSNWQLQGYGRTDYGNKAYPFPIFPPKILTKNPAALYRRKFYLSPDLEGQENIIRFEGVDSAFKLWLNGEYIGYSQGSSLPAEFDLSQALNYGGDNLLALKVFKWSDGSYLEAQDSYSLSGIFRDVYLYSQPYFQIEDFKFQTDFRRNMEIGILNCEFKLLSLKKFIAAGSKIKINISDQGFKVAAAELELPALKKKRLNKFSEKIELQSVKPWSSENPYLYQLELRLINPQGEKIQTVRQKIGFRTVEFKNKQLFINSQPVMIKGVNKHDFDPQLGRAITKEQLEADIRLMKKHNINAIRTAYYPNQPYFYELCDRYGLYVLAETDLEIQPRDQGEFSSQIANSKKWTAAFVDRMQRMIEHYKNHPSIISWSLANEANFGDNHQKMVDLSRRIDPRRPIYYESRDRKQIKEIIGSLDSLIEKTELSKSKEKDLILCEYLHQIGNVSAKLKEYKYLIAPFKIKDFNFKDNSVTIKNSHDFIDSSGFRLNWEIKTAGMIIESGSQEFELKAGQQKEFKVKDLELENLELLIEARGKEIEANLTADSYLKFSIVLKSSCFWAEAGHEITFKQFKLPFIFDCIYHPAHSNLRAREIKVEENSYYFRISGDDFECYFNKAEGSLSNYIYQGKELLVRGAELKFWQSGPANHQANPKTYLKSFKKEGQISLENYCEGLEIIEAKINYALLKSSYLITGLDLIIKAEIDYKIYSDGEIEIYSFGKFNDQQKYLLPKIALELELNTEFKNISWFGRGPDKSVSVNNRASYFDLFTKDLKNFKPNSADIDIYSDNKWLALKNKAGRGLEFFNSEEFDFALKFKGNKNLNTNIDSNSAVKEIISLELIHNNSHLAKLNCLAPNEEVYQLKDNEFEFQINLKGLD